MRRLQADDILDHSKYVKRSRYLASSASRCIEYGRETHYALCTHSGEGTVYDDDVFLRRRETKEERRGVPNGRLRHHHCSDSPCDPHHNSRETMHNPCIRTDALASKQKL
jgi:hypothetical protein